MMVYILLRDIFLSLDPNTPVLIGRAGDEVEIITDYKNGTLMVKRPYGDTNEPFYVGKEDLELI